MEKRKSPTTKQYKGMNYHLWNPFTNMKEFLALMNFGPNIITRGEGPYVFNSQGKRFINGMSSLWNVAVGFGRQEIIDAVTAQMNELTFGSCFRQANPKAIELAAKLVEITGGYFQYVYLGTNGSEAVEAAIKMARQYHRQSPDTRDRGRYKILSLHGSYHGVSYGAMSTSGLADDIAKYGPVVPGFIQIAPPYCYRCPYNQKSYPECGLDCARSLEETIQNEGEDTVAAFILEPIMGVCGIIKPPDEYYQEIGQICKAHGVLLIADEVTTGFGRTGELFATQSWDPQPDILCLGKAISSGYLPLSATLATDAVFERFLEKGHQFNYGSTASGHPVCSAAGLVNIDILLREKLSENAAKVGSYMISQLKALMEKSPIIGDVRGQGLMIGIELVNDKESKIPLYAGEMAGIIFDIANLGLIIYYSSGSNYIGLFPPLITSMEIADEIIGVLDKVLAYTVSQPGTLIF